MVFIASSCEVQIINAFGKPRRLSVIRHLKRAVKMRSMKDVMEVYDALSMKKDNYP